MLLTIVVAIGVFGGWVALGFFGLYALRGLYQGVLEQHDPANAWRCAHCDVRPDELESRRIRRDLAMHPGPPDPVAWYCPECAPSLAKATSGLCWDVLDVTSRGAGSGVR